MSRLRHLPALLLVLNWLALAAAFAGTCMVQGNILWWLRLDWTGWLTEFSAMTELEMLPAGSVWLAWLAASAVWTLVGMLVSWTRTADARPSPAPAAMPAAEATHRQPGGVSTLMQSHPEWKDKILKLHQSLDKL
jgi:hypothetical protein